MPPTPPSEHNVGDTVPAGESPTEDAHPFAPDQSGCPLGTLADDHPLSARARTYGEWVVRGDRWPLGDIALEKLTWATSTRAKRRHGRCAYEADGHATITLSERTADRAGFSACQATIRHELVHAWQYQHRGEHAVVIDAGFVVVDDRVADEDAVVLADSSFSIETGHGDSFRAWVEPLSLSGRCSSYYDPHQSDFAYVYGCPACGDWWGRHRLCPSVRQAAHGLTGSTGYRYCTDCDVLVHLQVGSWYLGHGEHDDEAIRAFADGEWLDTDRLSKPANVGTDLPVVHVDDASGTTRPN